MPLILGASLRCHSNWNNSSTEHLLRFRHRHKINLILLYANNKGTHQPVHLRCLSSALLICHLKTIIDDIASFKSSIYLLHGLFVSEYILVATHEAKRPTQ